MNKNHAGILSHLGYLYGYATISIAEAWALVYFATSVLTLVKCHKESTAAVKVGNSALEIFQFFGDWSQSCFSQKANTRDPSFKLIPYRGKLECWSVIQHSA